MDILKNCPNNGILVIIMMILETKDEYIEKLSNGIRIRECV